jgi:hypothetical protein
MSPLTQFGKPEVSSRLADAAGSKTQPLTKSRTVRSTFGHSGSVKSNMYLDDPSHRRFRMTAICAELPSRVADSTDRIPPFAMFCRRLDRCPLWAESAPSLSAL